MLHILLDIKTTVKTKVSKSFIGKIAKQVLDIVGIKKGVEISLLLVGEDKIRTLNRRYRGQNRVTDVLAFSQVESRKHFVAPKTGLLPLGDIIICYPQAKRQAKRFGHLVLTEVAILFTHGLLHLLGMDHEISQRRAKRMMELEKKIIRKLNL